VDILLAFLFGAVVIALLMHLHFKDVPDVRGAVVGPSVFAVIGALIGISVGMMWLWVETEKAWEGRIYIDRGVLNAFVGGAVGAIVGTGAKVIFDRFPRTRAVGVVFTLMLLAASIGAPTGWLYGEVFRHRKADGAVVEAVRSTQSGMMWGSAFGCAVGFALGLFEVSRGHRLAEGAKDEKSAS
jgi:hypothetical protein